MDLPGYASKLAAHAAANPNVVASGQRFILVTTAGPFVYIWNSDGRLEYCIRQKSNVTDLAVAPTSTYRSVALTNSGSGKHARLEQEDTMFSNADYEKAELALLPGSSAAVKKRTANDYVFGKTGYGDQRAFTKGTAAAYMRKRGRVRLPISDYTLNREIGLEFDAPKTQKLSKLEWDPMWASTHAKKAILEVASKKDKDGNW